MDKLWPENTESGYREQFFSISLGGKDSESSSRRVWTLPVVSPLNFDLGNE